MRITFNWGTGIAAVYTVFALATTGFVTFAMSQRVDLVSSDYYAQSLRQDQRIAAERNAGLLEPAPSVVLTGSGQAMLSLPSDQAGAAGAITWYRPSDPKADRTTTLALDRDGRQQLPLSGLMAGRGLCRSAGRPAAATTTTNRRCCCHDAARQRPGAGHRRQRSLHGDVRSAGPGARRQPRPHLTFQAGADHGPLSRGPRTDLSAARAARGRHRADPGLERIQPRAVHRRGADAACRCGRGLSHAPGSPAGPLLRWRGQPRLRRGAALAAAASDLRLAGERRRQWTAAVRAGLCRRRRRDRRWATPAMPPC